jgi:transposase-like protein
VITMEILERIKRLYFRDKKSLHDIARLTGLSRNTIRRWVREPQAEDALKYVREDMPSKLAAYSAEIEQALNADSF